MKYKNLFSPIMINKMMVKNRIVATPTSEDFEEKAIGGAGIVIAGHSIVEYGKSSFLKPNQPIAFEKYQVQETCQRIRRIHQYGAKASIELMHAGKYARVIDFAMGPDDEIREDGTVVKAMTTEMMEETCRCYANVAREAKELGFDMVFMHFGHGWLPAQFLSPLFNHRTDEYGGSIENRMKFPKKILEYVRKAVGPDFPVDMRISANEYVDGGISFEDVKRFILEVEPLIDCVHISSGLDMIREANIHCTTTNFEPHIPNATWAAEIKKIFKKPVAVVGAILSPEEGEELLEKGFVDLVAYGRSFIADPNWPRKAACGQAEDIVPCLRCVQCYHIATNRRNVGCSVNPRYTNEHFIPQKIEKSLDVKKVVIIGGGPGGIKAALTASQRGHNVVLIEKNDRLGGQLIHVSKEHYKEDVANYLRYLLRQIEKSKVNVILNTIATKKMLLGLKPDAIIIATGAKEILPPIKGIDNKFVYTGTQAIENSDNLGEELVVIGGGTIGIEIALEESLINNKKVTVIEMGNEIASQGNMLYKIALKEKLGKCKSLNIQLNSQCLEIGDNNVLFKDEKGKLINVKADNVIVCTGLKANNDYLNEYYGITSETMMIGDCVKPRKIMEAVFEGHSIALNI